LHKLNLGKKYQTLGLIRTFDWDIIQAQQWFALDRFCCFRISRAYVTDKLCL